MSTIDDCRWMAIYAGQIYFPGLLSSLGLPFWKIRYRAAGADAIDGRRWKAPRMNAIFCRSPVITGNDGGMVDRGMAESLWSVAVVGPGGVGGLLGAVLARGGHRVVYVARPDTAAALNAAGMSVRSAE